MKLLIVVVFYLCIALFINTVLQRIVALLGWRGPRALLATTVPALLWPLWAELGAPLVIAYFFLVGVKTVIANWRRDRETLET